MKVLLIDVNCKGSSTGKIVYDLYSYLNAEGDIAAVCYGRGDKIDEKNIYKFGLDWETYLHALLTRVTGYTGCFSFFSTRRLLKYIEQFKPDVVHIHELHAYFVNIKPLISYLKKKHIKTVMTLHCEFAYTGKCGHSVECEQWKTECKKCPHLKEYVSTLWFDHTGRMFNQKRALFEDFDELTIVTPSQWLADREKESFLKNHIISVIHNGVDTNIFYPRETETLRNYLGIQKDEKVVLALAPHLMSETKGGWYVLQMAKMLENEKIKFILVGIDEPGKVSAPNVYANGLIKNKEKIAQFYSMADMFVICSQSENYPTTCLEAQACGTTVYGFDTGGIRETCLHPKGHIVQNKDIDSLAEMIKVAPLKTNQSERELADEAAQIISSLNTAKQYKAVYEGKYVGGVMNNAILFAPIYNSKFVSFLYSLADVMLLCSVKETFSMTCAEALCCGASVVAFKCCAPETIFERPYAKFVDYADISALKDCLLETIYRDTNENVELYGKNNFSAERMCRSYRNLYERSWRETFEKRISNHSRQLLSH